jgi:hypothetical protein
MIEFSALELNSSTRIIVDLVPDTCPHCHYSIVPIHVNTVLDSKCAYLSFFCPRNECSRHFIYEYNSYYLNGRDSFSLSRPINGTAKGVVYSDTIKNLSSGFVDIYGQAEAAEHHGLKDICGVGYRKALEFLIKDYIIKNDPELKSVVENKLLAACIGDYIENKKIVDISKRAVWLGNDETHYIRKWEGMDISHLKQLITLTVHWIETEELTNSMIAEMPDPKKK